MTTERRIYEGVPEVTYEDGMQAAIAEIDGDDTTFVRIQSWESWDSAKQPNHSFVSSLADRRVRVTVEILESEED